jgi:hypothetical protein
LPNTGKARSAGYANQCSPTTYFTRRRKNWHESMSVIAVIAIKAKDHTGGERRDPVGAPGAARSPLARKRWLK